MQAHHPALPSTSMRRTHLAAALLAVGLASQPLAGHAQSALAAFAGLGTQGGTASYASALNESGLVVGYVLHGDYTVTSAFAYSGGVSTPLVGLGGRQTYAFAVNNAGQIVGQARTADNTALRAVSFAGGVAQDVNPPGLTSGEALGINDSGQVVGSARSGSVTTGFILSGGSYASIGPLDAGGHFSAASAINAAGQVVGYADAVPVGGDIYYIHAFLRSANGVMQDLGALNGANSNSFAAAINSAGQVVGSADFGAGNAGNHAFSFSQGVMSDLGTLGGANSNASALNGRGWIVGDADTASGALHAVLWMDGIAYDLNAVAPAGWTLNATAGITSRGQIAGSGTHDGHDEAFVLSLKATWQGVNGSWDSAARWRLGGFGALGQTPDALHDVLISPPGNATILGSAGASVRSLTVQGNAGSIVTFHLNDGVTGTTDGTRIGANAVITGSGQLDGPLTVQAGGVLQVGGGQTMLLTGGPVAIEGAARIYGGGGTANLSATTPVTVAVGGQLNLQGANLDLRAGIMVQGQLNAGASGNNVAGAVVVAPAGKVVLSGNSGTSFYDAVEVQGGAEFRVSAGATATFFGLVTQRTGAVFSGTGGKFYEGGLSVGASPGLGVDAGSVSFGDSNFYLAEIGGTGACTTVCASDQAVKDSSYDKYIVAGHLALGGTLKLVSWNGFVAQAGQTFDLLDWGSGSGQFTAIDSSGLQIAAGTTLDLSQLYTLGTVGVVAVPEPSSLALLATGLAGLLFGRRAGASRGAATAHGSQSCRVLHTSVSDPKAPRPLHNASIVNMLRRPCRSDSH